MKSYKMKSSDINYTVKNNLCLGCGICADACPTKSIVMEIVKGEWRPVINPAQCLNKKGCNKCYKVCSGVGMEIKKYANDLYSSSETSDKYIGNYERLYTGQPSAFIATTSEEILESKGSKYAPVQLSGTLRKALLLGKRYVIVGLPCHIQSVRKWAKIDSKIDKVIFAYFSLYCSSERCFYAQDYLCRYFNIEKCNIKEFSFREKGKLKFIGNNGENLLSMRGGDSPVFHKYYRLVGSHFKPNRCQMCVDHYGYLADMSFGDIGIAPYTQDKIGINSLIVRNPKFIEILNEAIKDGCIELKPLDPDLLNKSQGDMMFSRLKKAKAKCILQSLIGKKSVEYDLLENESTTFHDLLKIIVVDIKRFIGRRKYLWFLIDFENRNQKL